MRHIIKYLLVIAVLVAGYHAASHFRTVAPQATNDEALLPEEALSRHPNSQPHASTPPTQTPLAALIDTEQLTAPTANFDGPIVRSEPSVDRLPRIKKSETTDSASKVQRPVAGQRKAAGKGPSKKKLPGRGKWNSAKNPTTRKGPQKPVGPENRRVADDSGTRTKTSKSNRSHAGGGGTNTSATPSADVASNVTRRSAPADRSSSFPGTRLDDDWLSSEWSPGRGGSNTNLSSAVKKAPKPKKDNTPAKTTNQPHRHRIVDNDTLPKLAQAYFGDRSRYLDIFRANRDVLSDPRLLPVGVEITIPGGQTQNAVGHDSGVGGEHAPDDRAKKADMVPVPSYALPPRGTEYRPPFHTGHLDRSRFGA